jgi:hypothetical protein
MAYRGAKVGQVVNYARNPWEEKREAKVIKVYKSPRYLVADNSAVVMLGPEFTFPLHVELKDLYRKASN